MTNNLRIGDGLLNIFIIVEDKDYYTTLSMSLFERVTFGNFLR